MQLEFVLTGMQLKIFRIRVLMFLFAVYILKRWLTQPQDPGNAIPAWAIPVVAALEVPVVGTRMPIHGIHEICIMFFAIGALFTVVLVTIIFSRLLFQPPMPVALQPTLIILAVPFALLLSDYNLLTHSRDMMASVLYYLTLFMLLIFGGKVWLLSKSCPFRVTWWAVSFPLSAACIADPPRRLWRSVPDRHHSNRSRKFGIGAT